MQNAGLDESEAGINIAKRNINNLRYADNITLMSETKESVDASERWEWRAGLKLNWVLKNFQKTKIMASGPITS